MKLALWDFQTEAFNRARQAVRDGHRRILIVSPTGSGKSVIGAALMDSVVSKGGAANFVVDRLSLINQTSRLLDNYGIPHGIVQADHERNRPTMPVQVCSIHTLLRRAWPWSRVDIFDEAHILMEEHKRRMKESGVITIGLTATPFTKGLAKYFDCMINVANTRDLINRGFLVPYRIFSYKEPDMTGVAVKSTGEWEEEEASKRALEVVGDVVKEYMAHADGRKFICSAVDIKHVQELQRQFLAAGINAATYTYKDKTDDRADVLEEFRRTNSLIRGLITVTAASRGFDQPDVSCIIMARPLRKSLAEHIQLFGRGLRIAPEKKDCVARGTQVLTDRGELPIEHITLDHKVWDGQNFVRHEGVVCRGVQRVIEYDGLIATPDHEVWTDDGWTRFEDAARWQRRIARTGVDGLPIRLTDDREPHSAWSVGQVEGTSPLRPMLWRALGVVSQLAQAFRDRCGVSSLQWARAGACSGVAVPAGSIAVGSLSQPIIQIVRTLRRSWNRVQVFICEQGGQLDSCEPRYSKPSGAIGSDRQRWPLRAWESSLVNAGREHEQYARVRWATAIHIISTFLPRREVCRLDFGATASNDDRRGDHRALEASIAQTEREVWDVLNAGPLHRFTANGLLVHNCLVLDHSGNAARFWEETETFFEDGMGELDDGKPKRKPPKRDQEKEGMKCPSCGHLHKPAPFCLACGHQYPPRKAVQHVPGTLKELISGQFKRELIKELWPQVCGYAHQSYPNDPDRAGKFATAVYIDLTGSLPDGYWYRSTKKIEPTTEVRNMIKAKRIAYFKRLEGKREAKINA